MKALLAPLSLLGGLLLAPLAAAQAPDPKPAPPPLGLNVVAVPDILYHHLRGLETGQGLLVTEVAPASRAAEIGLKPHDVLVKVGAMAVKDVAALGDKLLAIQPGEREVIEIYRGGRRMALSWPNVAQFSAASNAYAPPKSLVKPGGPPAVSVQARPLGGDKLAVTILYYRKTTGKLHRHAFTGSVDDIDRQVRTLAKDGTIPENVHDLINVAIGRLRSRRPAAAATTTGPAQPELDRKADGD